MTLMLGFQLLFLTAAQGGLPFSRQRAAEILAEVEWVLRRVEPAWSYREINCTCPLLAPGQMSMAAAGWEHRTLLWKKREVNVVLHELPSAGIAKEFMDKAGSWRLGEGWQREKYELGDGAYLARNKKEGRAELRFRVGRMLGEVDGDSIKDVQRLAELVARSINAG